MLDENGANLGFKKSEIFSFPCDCKTCKKKAGKDSYYFHCYSHGGITFKISHLLALCITLIPNYNTVDFSLMQQLAAVNLKAFGLLACIFDGNAD